MLSKKQQQQQQQRNRSDTDPSPLRMAGNAQIVPSTTTKPVGKGSQLFNNHGITQATSNMAGNQSGPSPVDALSGLRTVADKAKMKSYLTSTGAQSYQTNSGRRVALKPNQNQTTSPQPHQHMSNVFNKQGTVNQQKFHQLQQDQQRGASSIGPPLSNVQVNDYFIKNSSNIKKTQGQVHLKQQLAIQSSQASNTDGSGQPTGRLQQRSSTTSQGEKKLFAQEFYNLAKKSQRRDLVGFSLHNHPSGYPDGIFSSQKTSGHQSNGTPTKHHMSPSPRGSAENSNRLRKLHQSQIQQLKAAPNEAITEWEVRKYGIGGNVGGRIARQAPGDKMRIQSGSIDFINSARKQADSTTLPKISQQQQQSLHERSEPGFLVAHNGLSSQTKLLDGSSMVQQQQQAMTTSNDLTIYQDFIENNNHSQEHLSTYQRGKVMSMAQQASSGIRGSAQILSKLEKKDHSQFHYASNGHVYQSHKNGINTIVNGMQSVDSMQLQPLLNSSQDALESGTSNLYSEVLTSDHVRRESTAEDARKGHPGKRPNKQAQHTLVQPHHLNELRWQKTKMQQDRVKSDFNLFKTLQQETYGGIGPSTSNVHRGEYASPIQPHKDQSLRLSDYSIRDSKLPTKYLMKTNLRRGGGGGLGGQRRHSKEDQSLSPRLAQQTRHPGLKHQLQGTQIGLSEQQLNLYAKKASVFSSQNLSQEQIEIHREIKDRKVPRDLDLTKSVPLKVPQSYRSHRSGVLSSGKRTDETLATKRSSDASPVPTAEDILTGFTKITDVNGFEKKLQEKLDDMIDPQNIQIFNIDKSKELYKIVQNAANKQREQQAKQEKRTQRKNKQFQPVSQSQTPAQVPGKLTKRRSKMSEPSSPTKSNKSGGNNRSALGSRKQSKISSQSGSVSAANIQKANSSQMRKSQENVGAKQQSRVQSNDTRSWRVQKKTAQKDTSRPNYFAHKGRIDIEGLKQKFKDDLMSNMNLADKMGVFNVLKDMHYDATDKMQWIERRRLQTQKDKQEAHFPGYQEWLDKKNEEIERERLEKAKREAAISADAIGYRSEFNLGPNSKVDLTYIYKVFQRDGLKDFNEEMFAELLRRDEVIAFMSQIRQTKVKVDGEGLGEQERQLVDYIKYLVGETRNHEFEFKREDFAQKHELNIKSLKMPFDEYALQEENSMKTVANDIIERVDYSTVVQNIDEPVSIVRYRDNPKYAYFQICQKDSDLAIPLLAKVVNRQLALMNYQLSLGHVKAFVSTFDFNKDFVNRFLFKHCGLTDAAVEILLTNMNKLERVISLVLKGEEFGLKSIMAIKPLLERPKPNNLEVLRLVNCKISTAVTRELISTLRQSNQLKVLGLVNAKISESSMQELGLMIEESKCLRELDISWNVLKPQSYNTLIASLKDNKTLLTLNLSWNRLVDPLEKFEEVKVLTTKKTGASGNKNLSVPPSNKLSIQSSMIGTPRSARSNQEQPWFEKDAKFSEISQAAVENITFLLKRNKKLQHVNLTATGLTEYMILQIGRSITRAKSLISLHLCSNPGSTPRVKEYLATRTRCMPIQDLIKFPAGELIDNINNTMSKNILMRQLQHGTEQEGEKPVARETIKLKQNMERKRIYSLVNDFGEDTATDSRMIFTRVLGHKDLMPGSGQWKLIKDKHEECWVCDQEVYGLVFFDPDMIAEKAYMSTLRPNQEPIMRNIMEQLHSVASKEKEDQIASENPRSPIIMGDFTNWQPKPFKEIVEWQESIQTQFDPEAVISSMQMDKVLPYRKSDTSNFTKDDWFNHKKYTKKFYEEDIPINWKEILQKQLLFKKPHLINAVNTRADYYRSLFFMASMFKVGRHEFIIRAPQQIFNQKECEWVDQDIEKPDYMFYSNVSDIRVEEIHPYLKQRNTKQNIRYFNKDTSVFAQWKQDTRGSLEDAFLSDMEANRIAKLIKDPEDLARTTAYLKENYPFIKECYLELQYNSVYPFINKIELSSFCEKSHLIDEKLNMANCDLLFVSSNTNNKGGIKQKTGLIRCEFLEYLARLANFKYVQTHTVGTFHEAVKLVFEDYIKPNFHPPPWQPFRDDELWTIDVNDVFECNLDGITKLQNYYFTGTQRYMSDKDAINLLTKDALCDLTFTQAKFCLSFCKIPFRNEINDFEKYSKLLLVEMLEMIGRAAKVKYAHTEYDEEPLARKIEMILDSLFPLIRFRRREVFRGNESESASDDDY